MISRSELIERYFLDGFNYEEIIKIFYCRHSISFSLRILHKILRAKCLYGRVFPSPLVETKLLLRYKLAQVVFVLGSRQCTKYVYEMAFKSAKAIFE